MIKLCLSLFLLSIITLSQAINLDFKKIPVSQLLQIIAKISAQNIVVSDKVQGDMSLHLQDVTWQQALDIIVQSQNLQMKKLTSSLLIAPANYWPAQQQQVSRVIALHYAKAKNIAAVLTNKHSRDQHNITISTDDRTNSLVLSGDPQSLRQAEQLIKALDKPVKQVMIIAHIVSIDREQEYELGIRFGVTAGRVTGSLAGSNQLAQRIKLAQVPVKDRLWLDMPAVSTQATRLGLALFKLRPGVHLDMELSALESQGYAQVISSPKLITANHQTATIEAGQEIPYQEKTSSGATSVAFKKAVLSLKVTPEITPNGKILLHLIVNQDKRSAKEVQGVPAIDTRQVNTLVLVKNGQTMVLGGIYEHMHNKQTVRVPFLSRIPLIGSLFQYKKWLDSQQELLIFVTPKEVNEAVWQKKQVSS